MLPVESPPILSTGCGVALKALIVLATKVEFVHFLSPGVGSRSQVSLELGTLASPATDADRPPSDWSAKSAGTSAVGAG